MHSPNATSAAASTITTNAAVPMSTALMSGQSFGLVRQAPLPHCFERSSPDLVVV